MTSIDTRRADNATAPPRPLHLRLAGAFATLAIALLPGHSLAQVPSEAQAAFEAAVGTLAATNPRIQAAVDLGNLLSGATEWSADLLNQVVAIANQAGLAFDDLVPSVQGCIHEPDGTPLEAVAVVAMPGIMAMGMYGFTPILGITSGRATPATVGAVPVLDAYLSAEQRAGWGPGCYWLPFPISSLQVVVAALTGAVGAVTGERGVERRDIRVIPIVPGYHLDHAALGASFGLNRAFFRAFDSALQSWSDGQVYNP